jgi:hypothetical protein
MWSYPPDYFGYVLRAKLARDVRGSFNRRARQDPRFQRFGGDRRDSRAATRTESGAGQPRSNFDHAPSDLANASG